VITWIGKSSASNPIIFHIFSSRKDLISFRSQQIYIDGQWSRFSTKYLHQSSCQQFQFVIDYWIAWPLLGSWDNYINDFWVATQKWVAEATQCIVAISRCIVVSRRDIWKTTRRLYSDSKTMTTYTNSLLGTETIHGKFCRKWDHAPSD
jgi:hypothetical protein